MNLLLINLLGLLLLYVVVIPFSFLIHIRLEFGGNVNDNLQKLLLVLSFLLMIELIILVLDVWSIKHLE